MGRSLKYDIRRVQQLLQAHNDNRSPESVVAQYVFEHEAAQRLLNAPREERRHLYIQVYNELFERFPDHPELQSPPEVLRERAQRQVELVKPFCTAETVLLEIGAGDCHFSRAIAPFVKQVYALEVTPLKLQGEDLPANLQFVLFDGFDFPLPDASTDFAYSNQVLEHLHPDDALHHLREVYRVLRPNGKYLCITPYQYLGPHDVSKYFTEVASGLHLKEYTYRELSQQMRKAGFHRTVVLAHRPTPLAVILIVERLLELLPHQRRLQVIQKMRYPNLRASIAMIGYK